ncbi:MAG TPA: hypothetical protein VH370_04095 [Humisphaera sp.]|nr:hypothetical protein [Humisphaera sp.]
MISSSPKQTNEFHAEPQPAEGRPLAVAAILTIGFLAALCAVLALDVGRSSRGAADQNDWHLPVIRAFVAQWPHPDLSDYRSSTTPGYHLFVAWIGRLTSTDTRSLRIIGSLFTAGLLITMGLYTGRRIETVSALALCLPIVCSIYVFSSGVFLLPDNAGWWGVAAAMLIALRPKVDVWTYLLGGIVLLATVLMRQIHLWIAAPLLVSAIFGAARERDSQRAISRGAMMSLAILPAILVLLWFRHLWHGHLVPPNQISYTSGGNLAAPAMVLAVMGFLGLFYCGFLVGGGLKWRATIMGALIGAVVGIIPNTTYDTSARRFSGLWNAAKALHDAGHVPYILNRSILMIALAALGGAVIAAWLAALPVRERWIWAAAVIAFIAASAAAANPWQRYYEPFVLIAAAISIPSIIGQSRDKVPVWARIGPLLLALVCAVVTMHGLT